jgi:hypothetical protein
MVGSLEPNVKHLEKIVVLVLLLKSSYTILQLEQLIYTLLIADGFKYRFQITVRVLDTLIGFEYDHSVGELVKKPFEKVFLRLQLIYC